MCDSCPRGREFALRLFDSFDQCRGIDQFWLVEPAAGDERSLASKQLEHRDAGCEAGSRFELVGMQPPGRKGVCEPRTQSARQLLLLGGVDQEYRGRRRGRRTDDPEGVRGGSSSRGCPAWEGDDRVDRALTEQLGPEAGLRSAAEQGAGRKEDVAASVWREVMDDVGEPDE